MLSDTKAVVNTLLIVFFVTMMIFSPNVIDFAYFTFLFYFLWKLDLL